MASPNPYTKRRSPPNVVVPPQPRYKSIGGGGFFCKSVLFALFLLALPLFPSQAPDFVGETVLTKFWELIHLLFVGIAVAYGLFSRRNVESAVDLRMTRVDESSLSYVSRIFQVSSVFDEEFDDNSCEFVDVRSDESVSARASVVGKSESFVVESGELEESSEFGETNEVRAWNSQYFQGKSKVVVARPAYGLDGHVVHQPLGLPIRRLRSSLRDNAAPQDKSFADSCDGAVNAEAESLLADNFFDEVLAAPASPVPWQARPEMMGIGDNYPSNFQPISVDETLKSISSRSTGSSSSQTSYASQNQNRFSPSRSVSAESLNSNVEELVKEKSRQSSSRSSSPSLPPSPSLSPSPPSPELVPNDTRRRSPELVTDDTPRRASHSRHYSDGSLLEEDVRRGFENELEGSKVRGRKAEFFSKKERGSKSLNLAAESSRRGNKSRRSYPPESISSPVGGADDSTTRRQDLQQKSNCHLLEENIRKGVEADHNNLRVKKGRSHDSLELTAEDSAKDEKVSESFPALDVVFQPTNAKASRRAMRSSRGGRDTLPEKDVVTRKLEDDTVDSDKSRKKDLPGKDKEMKLDGPRIEPRSWRASSNVSLRGKSVRTIRSDRHGKDVKTDGDSSEDRAEAKVESRGRTKSRRPRQEELSIVLHQEKSSETRAKSEPEEVAMEEPQAEQQPEVTFEEEEEAAWESQSNASHDHNEVDRKAGEFIAKFREQIRLQKLISGEQPRGGGTGIFRNSQFR
ncbi:unnamed protein product [Arabidopsis thaliana]|uniref:Hydroxyproline-rich glycoprotein family protein n=2 Tax=Arabidopsis TaxID=3701 RepID=A0A8T2FGI0_ARASU|nr:hypothetical protein ISN44_As03g052270 [Arabidopsis suecica]CAA0387637.1 unnamed protein product [Arabidopsis thaliana]CAD5326351.1 unnamed protein product [Arabidopsis thaliana]VYS60986.1 unnamed protein product [Arabidopsis thaliana]